MSATSSADSDDAQYNLSLTISWITFAETKATILLTIALAFLGASLTDISALARVAQNWLSAGAYWSFAGLLLAHLAFYAFLIYSLWKFVDVVRPKLTPKSEKHSWYFFQSMALLSPNDFHDFTKSLTPENRLTQLNDQIYNNSVVARQKYATIATGLSSLIWAACLAALAVVPTLVADALLPTN